MSINAISYLSGNTTYQAGMFKRGPVGINMSTTLTGNYYWWGKVNAASTQFLIYTDSYTTNRTSQANAIPTAWSTPDLTDQSLINVINTIPERVGEPLFTTVTQAVNWLNQTNKYFLTKNEYENIVTSNLILNLDPAWYTSYPGTGTAWNDISGNNSNFTLINGVGFSTIGQGSLSFDGADDISTGNVSNINSTAGQYNTVTFWMYWAGNSGGFPFELGGYRLWTPGTNFGFNTGNGDIYGIDGTPLINTWVHVTAVFYNGAYTGNNKLYINGVLQTLTQRLGSASSGTATAGVAIGGYGGAYTSYPFQGKIGPFQIYNRALTADEIFQNYNAQKARFGLGGQSLFSGVTQYFDFSKQSSYPGTGTNLNDVSGNGYNGSIFNGSFTTIDGVRCWNCSTTGWILTDNDFVFGNNYTIFIWARAISDSQAESWRTLLRTIDDDHPLIIQENTDLLGYYDNNSAGFVSYGLTLNGVGLSNVWGLYTLVGSGGSTQKLYINDGTTNATVNYNVSGEAQDAWGNVGGGSQPFGYVSNMVVYNNQAFTQSQVNQYYQSTKQYY